LGGVHGGGVFGIGTHHAGQLLVTAGENITRIRTEAAFATYARPPPSPPFVGPDPPSPTQSLWQPTSQPGEVYRTLRADLTALKTA
jgi:hypothetical protein